MIGEALWYGDADTVDEAVEWYRMHWHVPRKPPIELPERVGRVIPIDGEVVSFDVLAQAHRWVAFAPRDACWVTIDGEHWDPDGLELVTIDDLEPYFAGQKALMSGHPQTKV